MCGISGFLGGFDVETLLRMSMLLAHRGPDGSGCFFDPIEGVGLAHRRLAIIDPSPAGHQPMWDSSGRYCISYNGEIYNFRSLRKDLLSEGYQFRSLTDTEVLLALFARHGTRAFTLLNGIFALGIWDKRDRRLYLARDRMGVKPLYYVRLHDSFAFASEMKPLLSIPKVGLDLDPVTLSSHISFIWAPAPHTMCREVRKLEPGRILVVSDRGRRVDFEEWEPASSHAPVCALTDRDVVECVRTTLRDSVQRQMVSDVPVGAFLSGGLDSSAVVSLARDSASAGGLDCFTWGNRNAEVESEGFQSDLPFAKLVSDHLSVSLNVAQEVPDLASGLATVIRCVEEPLADFAALSTYIIAGAARERGIKVLLSGVGGDDLFAGYRRHQAIQWDSAWDRLPIGMRRSIAKVTGLLPASSPAFRRLRKICTLAARSQADRFIDYFRWVEPEVAARLLAAREAPLELGGATKLIGDSYTRLRRDGNDVLSSMLKIEQQFYLPDHNLLYTDKMGMAAGVEVRVPLLDLSIVGLMNSLPSRFKIRGATTKWALRSAMQGVLPESVLRRSKVGFGIPLRKWLHGRLMVDCGHLIDEESVRNRGLFSAPAIRALREDDRAGRVDAAYTLLSLMCVELWCRQFLDQVSQIRSVDVRMEVEKYQASSAVRSAV